jgi:hypothetical protein
MSCCNWRIGFPRLREVNPEKIGFPNNADAPATPLYYGALPLLDA